MSFIIFIYNHIFKPGVNLSDSLAGGSAYTIGGLACHPGHEDIWKQNALDAHIIRKESFISVRGS
jgi:hypothetical protein